MEDDLHQENPKQENCSQSFILVELNSTKKREQWTLKCNFKCLSVTVNSEASVMRHSPITKTAAIFLSQFNQKIVIVYVFLLSRMLMLYPQPSS